MLLGLTDGSRKSLRLLSSLFQKTKSWKANKSLEGNAWVGKIILDATFTLDHLSQFIDLRAKVQEVHLNEEINEDISWALTTNGKYSAKSAYGLHFLVSTTSNLYKTQFIQDGVEGLDPSEGKVLCLDTNTK
jgi:purine nucleoside permease